MRNEKELREEFYRGFRHLGASETWNNHKKFFADFWLSKLHSHTKEVVDLIRSKRKPLPLEHDLKGKCDFSYNQALDDLLASLEDNKK